MFLFGLSRCGIALDAWMLPILDDMLDQPLEQPLMISNSEIDFQWPAAIKKMMKLTKESNDQGETAQTITNV